MRVLRMCVCVCFGSAAERQPPLISLSGENGLWVTGLMDYPVYGSVEETLLLLLLRLLRLPLPPGFIIGARTSRSIASARTLEHTHVHAYAHTHAHTDTLATLSFHYTQCADMI